MSPEIPHSQRSSDSSLPSEAVLPAIANLRVDSEDHFLYAMVSAFSSPPAVQFPPTDIAMRKLVVPCFIHLASLEDHDDLMSSDNRRMLVQLGRGLLDLAEKRSSDGAQPERERWVSGASRSHSGAKGNFFPIITSRECEPQPTTISLSDELDLIFFASEDAESHDAGRALKVGLLCLKINRFGCGPREEEALRILGGSPEVFRQRLELAAVPLPSDLGGYLAPVVGSAMPDYSITDISNRHISLQREGGASNSEARWPNFSGCFWHDMSPPSVELEVKSQNVRSGELMTRHTELNLASRFDGLTVPDRETPQKNPGGRAEKSHRSDTDSTEYRARRARCIGRKTPLQWYSGVGKHDLRAFTQARQPQPP